MINDYVDDSTKITAVKACEFPINRCYTREQNHSGKTSELLYYSPNDWVSSRSPNKCIGLRSVKVVPYSTAITLKFYIREDIDSGSQSQCKFDILIGKHDSMERIIYILQKTLNNFTATVCNYFAITYNNNRLTFELIPYSNSSMEGIDHYFWFDGKCLEEFCKVFNQDVDIVKQILTTPSKSMVFDNVWDRQTLYIHSSISNDYNQILCDVPSNYDPKQYLFPCSQNVISFWFTTDTQNRIDIKYCNITINLAFIYNYQNAAI